MFETSVFVDFIPLLSDFLSLKSVEVIRTGKDDSSTRWIVKLLNDHGVQAEVEVFDLGAFSFLGVSESEAESSDEAGPFWSGDVPSSVIFKLLS